jgi:hypothetical protein
MVPTLRAEGGGVLQEGRRAQPPQGTRDMIDALSSLADVLQIAHDIGIPHQEPPSPAKGNGGGASAIVIAAGILVSLVAVGGLIWLKRRVDD